METKLAVLLLIAGHLPCIIGQRKNVEIVINRNGNCNEIAKLGDKVDVHYTGRFQNGNVFDSSLNRGTPFEFTIGVGQVIAGWDEGIQGMCMGERRHLVVPSHLAYGGKGVGGVIPPNADLNFDVEMVRIHRKPVKIPPKPSQPLQIGSPVNSVPGLAGPPPEKSTKNTIQVQSVSKPRTCSKKVSSSKELVKVHYTGYHYVNKLIKFETSKGGEPYEVQLGTGDVIPGWEGGLQGMCVGEYRRLVIPPKLGYGAEGKPPHIPGDATLVYEIELMGIRPALES